MGFRLTVQHWVLAVTLAALVAMALPPARQLLDQHQRILAEEEKLSALLNENARLGARLERLKDPEYVEKLAREQLEMVRPGETSYVVVPAEQPDDEITPEPRGKKWYETLWDWIRSHS